MAMESSVSKAVRQGLLATTLGSLAWVSAGTAVAEEAPAVKDDVERIEVTGSRISRTDVESASPVEILDRSFIEKSGVSNIADLLKQVPANQSTQDVRQTNGFAGAASGVDLNGLGVGSTLTLLNGRRMAPHGRPTMTGTAEMFVNIDTIPLAAVERVEILRDGASAIYGSDAIAGVVNIILRKDYEGVELSTRYGQTTDGSNMEEIENSVFAGVANDKTSLTMMVSQYKRDGILGSDLGLSADNGLFDFSSSATPAGTVWVQPPKDAPEDWKGLAATSDRCPQDNGNGSCSYDYMPVNSVLPEIERWGLMANLTHELNADHIFKVETLLSNSESSYQSAPAPWFADSDGVTIDLNNPIYDQLQSGDGILSNGVAWDGSEVTFRRRFEEVGPRTTHEESNSYRVLVGLDGYLFTDWTYSTGVVFNKSYTLNRSNNMVSASRATEALNEGVDLNGDGVKEWLNPLDVISADMADYLRATTFQESTYTTWSADFTISNSELFEMWAGYVGMAAGIEYREEKLEDISSDNLKSGDLVGTGGSDAAGERDQFSAYVEFAIPLMDNDFGYWDMQVAGRFEDYSDFGTKTTPKVAMSYTPTPGVMVRGSYSEGFRAPNLYELDGASTGFTRVTDPQRCNPDDDSFPNSPKDCGSVQTRLVSGGNPDLDPETSTSYNAGIVLDFDSIGWVEGLSMTVDYFNIEHKDRIEKLSATEILRLEEAGKLPEGTAVIRGPAEGGFPGEILEIHTFSTNLGSRTVTGYNMGLNYILGLGQWGELSLNNSTYYLDSYEVEGEEWAGTWQQPRVRNTSQIGWDYGDWASSMSIVYRGRYDDYYGQYFGFQDEVPSMTTFNLRVNYIGFNNLTLTVGADNLFDKDRPVDGSNDTGGISDLDNPYGRFVYGQAKLAF
ncbi:TonB-dependent receptor plug domain-containing protein [Ferrimonas balearica]|uniref:TonB-dependent receptor plug domain-containing protein n=2 Tax=Ferrimonas balearica TaxID=44012 RepID=UPI001C56E579|nr:TonB-dependent receptor [Ferrimonas balearica]MBW3165097.1 TonB-dependent receptor [Ferrimonas balearica]MBY5980035.1 TonB-dependent receptor [Ferrimonas balearica]